MQVIVKHEQKHMLNDNQSNYINNEQINSRIIMITLLFDV